MYRSGGNFKSSGVKSVYIKRIDFCILYSKQDGPCFYSLSINHSY